MGDRASQHAAEHEATELLADLGAIVGAVARASIGDPRVLATVLIWRGTPVLTLNASALGTDAQGKAIMWAAERVDTEVAGFYYLRA